MSVIYRPTGMAREYSPYALNLYIGCSHRCKYCYAPHTLQKSEKAYFGTPEPRKNILALLESDLKKTAYTEQILLSFVGDVYCESADGGETTREALSLLNAYHAPVAVLSKGGKRMLRDLDLFGAFGERIAVGTTLTLLDQEKSREWEPYASTPEERLETLKILHESGIRTFASFEPTIEPRESPKMPTGGRIGGSISLIAWRCCARRVKRSTTNSVCASSHPTRSSHPRRKTPTLISSVHSHRSS